MFNASLLMKVLDLSRQACKGKSRIYYIAPYEDLTTFSPFHGTLLQNKMSQWIPMSRKRHLSSVSNDDRIVARKMEEVHENTDHENTEIQDPTSNEFNITGLFVETHASNKHMSCNEPTAVSSGISMSNDACQEGSDNVPADAGGDQNVAVKAYADSEKHISRDTVTAQIKIPHAVHTALKSGGGELAARLAETGCTVQLPRKMKKPVTVCGSSEEDVQLACELLKTGLTPSKQARPLLTHFVSVRLTEEPLRRRFEEFRTLVRDLQPDHDLLPDRLFQRPEKLHISLAMLQLPDEAALQAARDVLDICCRQLCDQPPVRFRLRGLGTFGTATRSRVLYSRPEPAECLQSAAELVYSRLSEAGLTGRQQESITLHATLLNTTFLTRGAAGRRWRKFRGFDHGPLVEKLGEFDFGEVQPAAFEISSLTEKAADGYYAAAGLALLRVNELPQLDSCLSSGVGVGELRPAGRELRPAGGELQTDVEESRTDVESRTDTVEPRTDVGEAPTDAVEPETDIGELQVGELGTGVEESRSDAEKSRTDLGESRTGDVDFQAASAAISEESDLGVTVETTVVESPATPLGDMSRLAGLTLSGYHGASQPTPSDPEPLSHVVASGSKDGAATEPP